MVAEIAAPTAQLGGKRARADGVARVGAGGRGMGWTGERKAATSVVDGVGGSGGTEREGVM